METKSWSRGTIRLKWPCARLGYVIGSSGSDSRRSLMAGTIIRKSDPGPLVCPRNDAIYHYDITIGEKRVFLDLLRMPESDEGVLAFAKDWGVLSGTSCPVDEFIQTRRQIEQIYLSRWKYRELVEALKGKQITSIDVRVESKGARPEVLWYARNLREFCWLEVLADLGGTSEIARCPSCGKFFGHSAAKGRNPTYCADACRQAAHRKRQRRAKTL